MSTSYEIYNPLNHPEEELPIIYGFNNGGEEGYWNGELISEDGKFFVGHTSSSEDWLLRDLGILKGMRPDRHEDFRKHYPDGYKMQFVSYREAFNHEGLKDAFRAYNSKPNPTR